MQANIGQVSVGAQPCDGSSLQLSAGSFLFSLLPANLHRPQEVAGPCYKVGFGISFHPLDFRRS